MNFAEVHIIFPHQIFKTSKVLERVEHIEQL